MNQSLENAKIAFAKRLNAHFRSRTDVDQELFLTDLFEQLGAKTADELNQVATLIIQNHKQQVWPSVAHVLEYANKVGAKRDRVRVIEIGTMEWDKERQRKIANGESVTFMDRQKTWTVSPSKSPARRTG